MAILYGTMQNYIDGFKREFVLDNPTTPVVVNATDRNAFINEARDEIAEDLLCVTFNTNITAVKTQASYTVTSASSKIVKVADVLFNNKVLDPIPTKEAYLSNLDRTSNGTPTRYYINEQNKTLYMVPVPSTAKTIGVYGYALPSAMSSTSTSEAEIPPPFRRGVVDYALWKAFSRDSVMEAQGPAKSQYYKQKYDEMIVKTKVGRLQERYPFYTIQGGQG